VPRVSAANALEPGIPAGADARLGMELDARNGLAQFYGMFKIIGSDQQQYGPESVEVLRRWIVEGRANGQTMVQAEGSAEWKPMASFPEFAAVLAAAPPTAPQAGPAGIPPLSAGPLGSGPVARPDIQSYLPYAIVVSLCCCLPLGIPAIVFAAQVNSKLASGDVAGAQAASDKAKMWCLIALAAGLIANLAYLLLMLPGMIKGFHG
jgi:hypothetical protein